MGTYILLSNRSVLKLEGAEATSFLQGIITQDMALLENQAVIYTSLLTPQGKILFDFFIHKKNDHVLIDCHTPDCDALLARLTMYKLRSNVTLSDESSHYAVAADLSANMNIGPDPRCTELGGRVITERTDIMINDSSLYRTRRMELGIADSEEIGSGEYFPHECNLDQLHGVSFTKGCYVGQEVVSRMHHRGTARNRILPFTSDAEHINTNEMVKCEDKKIGTIIAFENGKGLAIIRLDRLAKCDETKPKTAAGIPIDISVPSWANFDISSIEK